MPTTHTTTASGQTQALAVRRDYDDLHSQAVAFASSTYFGQGMRASQAVTKILAGKELGMTPMASMTGIYLVKGKIQIGATALAAVVQNSERYDYRIIDLTDERCELRFIVDGEPREPTSVFTIQQARTAGLAGKDNWKAYPQNMLFARAMSNGVKWHCPGLLAGMPVYTEADDLEPAPAVAYSGPADDLTAPMIVEAEVVEAAPQADPEPPATLGQQAAIAGMVETSGIDPEAVAMKFTAIGIDDPEELSAAQADDLIEWLKTQIGEEVTS